MSTNAGTTETETEGQGAGGSAGAGGEGGDGGAGGGGEGGEGRQGGDQGKLTSENQSLRARLRAAEQERDTLKSATQTDLERAQAKAEQAETKAGTLEGELQGLRLEVAVNRQAGKLGIIDPDGAVLLMDRSLVVYEDGKPTDASVKAALREVVKERPYLVRQGGADQGGGQEDKGGGTADMNAILRAGRGG